MDHRRPDRTVPLLAKVVVVVLVVVGLLALVVRRPDMAKNSAGPYILIWYQTSSMDEEEAPQHVPPLGMITICEVEPMECVPCLSSSTLPTLQNDEELYLEKEGAPRRF